MKAALGGWVQSTHAAVAISALGARLGSLSIAVNSRGYRSLLNWARSSGPIRAFGVEGTGSYGADLSRFLSEHGYRVLEVNRPSRQVRHQKGKDDAVDAESAARSVLAGQASARPKSGTSTVEMIRHLKVARDAAVKARSQAMQALKAIIVSAPLALREGLDRLTGKMALLRHLAALPTGPLTSTMASAKASLRAIARRWLALDVEVRDHDASLGQLTQSLAPELMQAHGTGTGTAAEVLILVGDNPERIHFEAALAKLAAPVPSRAPAAGPTDTASTEGVIARPIPPSTAWSSSACGPTSPPSTMSGAAPPRERASPRSSGASNAMWRARSLAISAAQPTPNTQREQAFDHYRSIKAAQHPQRRTPPGPPRGPGLRHLPRYLVAKVELSRRFVGQVPQDPH
ncbi:IS110 family transposase [Muricoccus aerilatus]|uniref:IS110 family transposase n=1 Tax=Muricoccus aerilatus TaxID=452982 RepID=UPI001B8043CF|nr:transposase [Roseomonas aerilata]